MCSARLLISSLWILVAVVPATANDPTAIDFNRDIRPLLSNRCFACHGPDQNHRQADLRLDDEQAAKEYAIDTNIPEDSLFFQRITSADPDSVMPPPSLGKPLTANEIEMLRRWIADGAPYAQHWAYVQPTSAKTAPLSDPSSAKSWIDAWIQRSLEQQSLTPAPTADSTTLLRRLAFDLTGLPPAQAISNQAIIDKFQQDSSTENYLQIVDHLLASPHFGERFAIYWLDLVRYADTVGYHGDQDHNITPYRDWVIDALNQNMPFDQFTREQLAGDLLPNPTTDQLIASGYNRLLQTSHEGGVQPKEYLAIYAADRVRNLSAVWLGATLGCAQCHDHKYDPFTMNDFYSMAAFFADIDEERHFKEGSNDLPTKRPPEIAVLRPAERQRRQSLARQLADIEAQLESQSNANPIEPNPNPTEQQTPLKQQQAELTQKIEQLDAGARMTMISRSIAPRPVRILPRGNWLDDSGPLVTPAVPAFFNLPLDELSPREHQGHLNENHSSPSRPTRLDLANWLTSDSHGVGRFTARVMANRIWALLLGQGLSPSLDDFGGQGQPPSHPELLDQLALEFIRSGWDLKQLIREIVLSHTYQQQAVTTEAERKRDPTNRWFARQSQHRLPAEMVRDQILAVSGLIVHQDGGPSARPYQPADYYRHLNFPTRQYVADQDHNQYRRGVYVHWQRQFLHPMLRALDAPSREECTPQRSRSNTPLAALVLLNDPTVAEASNVWAFNLLSNSNLDSDAARLQHAFQQALSRAPDEFELSALLQSLTFFRQLYQDDEKQSEDRLSVGNFKVTANPIDSRELAAWSELARIIINLHETTLKP